MITILEDGVHTCRKPQTCDQCLRLIEVGQRYRKQKTAGDGEFRTYRAHESCDAAYARYIDLAGLDPSYDEPPLLNELGPEDHCWILEEFPDVAERLGIKAGEPAA
jgi:hypothetical protein